MMVLLDAAVARDAKLVTTEKDAVRLPPDARHMVEVLHVALQFDDSKALDTLLSPVLDD